jgi:hypothetical protein
MCVFVMCLGCTKRIAQRPILSASWTGGYGGLLDCVDATGQWMTAVDRYRALRIRARRILRFESAPSDGVGLTCDHDNGALVVCAVQLPSVRLRDPSSPNAGPPTVNPMLHTAQMVRATSPQCGHRRCPTSEPYARQSFGPFDSLATTTILVTSRCQLHLMRMPL